MAYRLQPKKTDPPRRTMQDTTTPGRIIIENGNTAELAIPCFYKEIHLPTHAEIHSRDKHDHEGWVDPRRPDACCQPQDFVYSGTPSWGYASTCDGQNRIYREYLDMSKLIPIRLLEEGYTNSTVAITGAPAGLNTLTHISMEQDWVVRVSFDVAIPNMDKPLELPFAVRVSTPDGTRRDTVSRGVLVILPAPLD